MSSHHKYNNIWNSIILRQNTNLSNRVVLSISFFENWNATDDVCKQTGPYMQMIFATRIFWLPYHKFEGEVFTFKCFKPWLFKSYEHFSFWDIAANLEPVSPGKKNDPELEYKI